MATKVLMKATETELACLSATDILVKPELAFTSETNSILLTRQLFAVSISAICYMRKVFSKEYFRPRKIGTMSMHMLQNVKSDPKITRFLKCVKGCFEAMKKGYLRDIIVAIQPPGQEDVRKAFESYTFRIKYSTACKFDDNAAIANSRLITIDSSKVSPKTLEQNIIDCLFNCVEIVKHMPDLPEGCSLGMMLTYYEGTPREYQPPGFEHCEYKAFEYSQGLFNFEVGRYSTPYHSVSMEANAKLVDADSTDISEANNSGVVENSQPEVIGNTTEVTNLIDNERTESQVITEVLRTYHDTSLEKLLYSPENICQLEEVDDANIKILSVDTKLHHQEGVQHNNINVDKHVMIKTSIPKKKKNLSDQNSSDSNKSIITLDDMIESGKEVTTKRKQVLDPDVFQQMCYGESQKNELANKRMKT
ncbi:HORMA domain-containing protein 2-like [Ctenocephalides felis]|uniref:HORMA domain-containing protein 2-like n=1 Tax=Ctenocephalides felis TaxID=7515 RepID=UPI000E6E38CC|nr:HORMA domain-containing protein 2-like [Ctenocephalides felis]